VPRPADASTLMPGRWRRHPPDDAQASSPRLARFQGTGTAAETLPGTPELHGNLVHACYPALAFLTVKSTVFVYTYRQIPFGKMPFCPAGMPAADAIS